MDKEDPVAERRAMGQRARDTLLVRGLLGLANVIIKGIGASRAYNPSNRMPQVVAFVTSRLRGMACDPDHERLNRALGL